MDTFKTEYEWAGRLLSQGDAEGAHRAFAHMLDAGGHAPARRALLLQGMGRCLHALNRGEEAVEPLREAWEMLRRELGDGHPASLGAQQNLSFILQAVGRHDESIGLGRTALAALIERCGEGSLPVADALIRLSASYYEAGNPAEAEALSLRAKAVLERLEPRGFNMSTCLNNLGRIAEERGEAGVGCELHRKAVEIRRELCGDGPETAFCLGNLGTALLAAGRPDEAAVALEEALHCYALAGRTTGSAVEGLRHNLELCRRNGTGRSFRPGV